MTPSIYRCTKCGSYYDLRGLFNSATKPEFLGSKIVLPVGECQECKNAGSKKGRWEGKGVNCAA